MRIIRETGSTSGNYCFYGMLEIPDDVENGLDNLVRNVLIYAASRLPRSKHNNEACIYLNPYLLDQYFGVANTKSILRSTKIYDVKLGVFCGNYDFKFEITARPVFDKPCDLKINKVLYRFPYTIAFWNDGDKTIVKCQPEDEDKWDPTIGLAMATVKKIYGTNRTKSNYLDNLLKNVDIDPDYRCPVYDKPKLDTLSSE